MQRATIFFILCIYTLAIGCKSREFNSNLAAADTQDLGSGYALIKQSFGAKYAPIFLSYEQRLSDKKFNASLAKKYPTNVPKAQPLAGFGSNNKNSYVPSAGGIATPDKDEPQAFSLDCPISHVAVEIGEPGENGFEVSVGGKLDPTPLLNPDPKVKSCVVVLNPDLVTKAFTARQRLRLPLLADSKGSVFYAASLCFASKAGECLPLRGGEAALVKGNSLFPELSVDKAVPANGMF